ncbi:hypothetical protein VN97_g7469 [Penicillium thymicola]|uniref:Uncharacterized protein n=1 Tax=Penicillium thymicola TaxID=293382 RepID=A0AAI9TEJ7_PENTH|nr:hypothetical protein VN97_g7469 [Penicillium thymicola]
MEILTAICVVFTALSSKKMKSFIFDGCSINKFTIHCIERCKKAVPNKALRHQLSPTKGVLNPGHYKSCTYVCA